MTKSRWVMCFSAALMLGAAGCNPERTDDTLGDATPEPAEPVLTPESTGMPAADDAGATAAPVSLTVASGSMGTYVADSTGRALYMLEGDSDGSKCMGDCIASWPPLRSPQDAPMATADSLQAGEIGTVERAGGEPQVTYNGHPLYYYAKDTGAGAATGQGVDDQWGEWYLVTPEGEALEDNGT